MMVELSVLPVGQDEKIGKYVAEVVRIIDQSGLEYRLTPMGTVITGDWDEVMPVIKNCHEKIKEMTDRVITKIRIDDERGGNGDFDSTLQTVEKILGKSVNK